MKSKSSKENVLTEVDLLDLKASSAILSSLLTTGKADPDDLRYVGMLMLTLADKFDK